MYKELIEVHKKGSSVDIETVESRIGVKFPDSFHEFTLNYEGARFKGAEITATQSKLGQSSYGVRLFLPVLSIGNQEIEYWNDRLVEFAEDSCGNYFVFKKLEMDSVYFWDHETGDFELVAESFGDFLDRIQRADYSEVPKPVNARVWVNPDFMKKTQG